MCKKMVCLMTFVLLLGLSSTARGQEFVAGADLSVLKVIEDAGNVYREAGEVKDPLLVFKDHGWNWIRLRLFHTPSGVGPESNTLAYTQITAKRFKDEGFKFLLDFHYSDTWADGGKQYTPAAWVGFSHTELVDAVFAYTRDCIIYLRNNGAMPDMVQIGNEVICGILWPDGETCESEDWSNFADLVQSAIDGVAAGRGTEPMPLIMMHIGASTYCWDYTEWFFDLFNATGVEYDVIGLSSYPAFGATFPDLSECLTNTANKYGKDIYIVETGYNWTATGKPTQPPSTPEGQKLFLEELVQHVEATPSGLGKGIFYWSPDWIHGDYDWGRTKWSGDWEDRALFDDNSNMLPAMTVFDADANDTDPPTPDPMTWATVPYATGAYSIAMVATTASDASGVEYYFDCTTTGGHDSDWQPGTFYEDTVLDPETEYCYQVKARDKSANQNETGWSTPLECATTDPAPTGSCHVGAIDLVGMYKSTGPPSGRGYYAEATITVHDQAHAALAGVTVDITWSGCVSGTDSDTTDKDGQVIFDSPTNPDGGTFTCCVDDLTKSGYPYQPADNHETCDSVTAP